MINDNNPGATFRRVIATALLASAMLGVSNSNTCAAPTGARDHWVATWTASPMPADATPDGINVGFLNQTLRETAHISIGGSRVRVRLSNAYGTGPLTVGSAHLALRDHAASIVALSDRTLMFNGKGSVTIPAGALVLSDPIEMSVAPLADLAISLYFPGATGPVTWHQLGTQTTYVAAAGDATATESFPVASTATSYYILAGVEVDAKENTGAVVTLGDSITDGYGSTIGANSRWPDDLARRLNDRSGHAMGVLNQGISGNRLLHDVVGPSCLARFDRDVLSQPGVTHVIVYEGINDIGLPGYLGRPADNVSSEDIIGALRQLIERAHDKGLKIYGATMTPFEGTDAPYYSGAGEAKREAVNDWIRSQARFDAVIDFDRVIRDPAHPMRLLPAYDSGDHLHPGDAGYAAMAAAIDPALLLGP